MRGALAIAAALVVLAALSVASAGDPPCISPAIGRVLEGMVQAHAFAGVVPDGYRLERLDVKVDHLEMGYDDADGPSVTVVLAVKGWDTSGQPADASGPHFEHRIVDARGRAPGPARDTMLRAAMLVDQAMPASEMKRCEGAAEKGLSGRGLGLAAAAAIMFVALVAGLIRRLRSPVPVVPVAPGAPVVSEGGSPEPSRDESGGPG